MLLTVDSVSLQAVGPSLTVRVGPGRSMSVYGPAASGKSRLLRILSGSEKPPRGVVKMSGNVTNSDIRELSRRVTPMAIAKKHAGQSGAARIAESLSAMHLWEFRKTPLSQLTDSQLAACEIMAMLASPDKILIVDGQFDQLDLWTMSTAFDMVGNRLREGAALIVATNRPEFAKRTDTMVVLKNERIVFAGSLADLERKFPSSEVEVETHFQTGVKSIVSPFEVDISRTEGGLKIQAKEGQKIAAKLLTEGYGDVKSVVLRRPDVIELLKMILTTS